MHSKDHVAFYLPTKPFSLVDAINRSAAATGSIQYAMAAGSANYNGHYITLYWNDYRQYYVCDFTWAGRIVVTRGRIIEEVLKSAVREYERQGLGASLHITVKPEDADKVRALGLVKEGAEPSGYGDWYTWRHKEVGSALWMEQKIGIPATAALLAAKDEADYKFLTSREGREELNKRKPILS